MLRRLKERLGLPGRLRRPSELADFVAGSAAYLSQASVYSYCRARTGFMGPKLFDEEPFVQSVEVCRWETYAASLGDVALVLDGALRAQAEEPPEARLALLHDAHAAGLDRHPLPAHRPQGWGDAKETFAGRLARAQLARPAAPAEIAAHAGTVLFEHLPFHASLLRHDRDMVINSMRFRMARFADELDRRLDLAALAAALQAGAADRAAAADM